MMFKTELLLLLALACTLCIAQKIKYKPMRIGDTTVPEMEFELSEPAPYDWKNQPEPPKQPYISNFKIETPPSSAKDEPEVPQKPQPFSFGFMSQAKDGQQSRMEQQDESGKVTGSYSIVDANGITRIVEYYADDTGFHANIKSNENGIETGELGSATITKL